MKTNDKYNVFFFPGNNKCLYPPGVQSVLAEFMDNLFDILRWSPITFYGK